MNVLVGLSEETTGGGREESTKKIHRHMKFFLYARGKAIIII
jgi:hypothetical protein